MRQKSRQHSQPATQVLSRVVIAALLWTSNVGGNAHEELISWSVLTLWWDVTFYVQSLFSSPAWCSVEKSFEKFDPLHENNRLKLLYGRTGIGHIPHHDHIETLNSMNHSEVHPTWKGGCRRYWSKFFSSSIVLSLIHISEPTRPY